ncbi:uncharacterized protein LOC144355722, partial [Saccoglossus kowalevskii]
RISRIGERLTAVEEKCHEVEQLVEQHGLLNEGIYAELLRTIEALEEQLNAIAPPPATNETVRSKFEINSNQRSTHCNEKGSWIFQPSDNSGDTLLSAKILEQMKRKVTVGETNKLETASTSHKGTLTKNTMSKKTELQVRLQSLKALLCEKSKHDISI